MAEVKPGTGGDHYIPYEERKGNESIVYFTRDLSAEGLKKIYEKISANLTGKIAVKLHTGEKHGPNILPRPWVKELLERKSRMPRSSKQTPIMKATATRPPSTGKR